MEARHQHTAAFAPTLKGEIPPFDSCNAFQGDGADRFKGFGGFAVPV